ncbi:MAG: molybdenum ABC transporter ATP-binding protein [Gammaproteobacteria bacterium]|nr:molybdenum ABC transporter ATP-binding protein [Gammaproteobacteria bacterium]
MSIDVAFRLAQRGGFALDVAFSAPGRGVTALFGRSGSGKTTVLRCIAGLQRAQGRCEINGESWQSDDAWLAPHRRATGYVFQEASLFTHLSVRGNLTYGSKRRTGEASRISVEDAIGLLGLGALLERSPGSLSGGERQRVAIARALLSGPRLLLMDEPLSALDVDAKQKILPYLERVYNELDLPVLYVTHDPQEVARLADRVVLLEQGQVRSSGPVAGVMTSLRLPFAGFDNASAVLAGVVGGHDETFHLTFVTCGGNRFVIPRETLAVGAHTRLQVHARDVSITLNVHHDSSISNIIPVVIADTRDLDHGQVLLRLRLDDGQNLLARITRRSAIALGIREGMFVYAQIKGAALIG